MQFATGNNLRDDFSECLPVDWQTVLSRRILLQHTATHRNTLQHTATHCNALQHTATHCMFTSRLVSCLWTLTSPKSPRSLPNRCWYVYMYTCIRIYIYICIIYIYTYIYIYIYIYILPLVLLALARCRIFALYFRLHDHKINRASRCVMCNTHIDIEQI